MQDTGHQAKDSDSQKGEDKQGELPDCSLYGLGRRFCTTVEGKNSNCRPADSSGEEMELRVGRGPVSQKAQGHACPLNTFHGAGESRYRRPHTGRSHLYISKNRQNSRTLIKSQAVVTLQRRRTNDWQRHKGSLWEDETILYLNWNVGYIFINVYNNALKICAFCWMWIIYPKMSPLKK